MPYKPPRPCRYAGCTKTTHSPTGYCDSHIHLYKPFEYPHGKDNRPSSAQRGYGSQWKAIREMVLRQHGIPRADWPLYDVHHKPAYNPAIEPDHLRYTLTPLLHADHTKVTNAGARRGKFFTRGEGGSNPCGPRALTGKAMTSCARSK
ncbi:MAG: hypothetical protein LBQ88_12405 [Treponema sp.]|nr:hypothetical protein [Treponema sp.]